MIRISRCIASILFLLSIILPAVVRAQATKGAGFGIESNFIAGKVFRHNAKFTGPLPDLSTAIELNLVQQTYGAKRWQQSRHFPLVGFGFTYTNYGIDSVYGSCYAIYPNIQFPIIRGKRLEWTFRLGFGLGYTTRRYELAPTWDTANVAIGSHINNFTTLSTDVRYHINRHFDVQLGGNFSHMSNAAYRQPNLGINMYGAHVGLRYYPVDARPARLSSEAEHLKNRWLVQARLGLSANGAGFSGGPIYRVYLASLYASKRWHRYNKAFIGLDYSYHEKIAAFLRNNEIFVGDEAAHSWKSAVFAGNEFLFGRVGILLQVGVYIKQAALTTDPYYEKLGGNFYIIKSERGVLKELFVSGLLKTHKAQAELAEIGVGVGF